jgi:hypothetical protein
MRIHRIASVLFVLVVALALTGRPSNTSVTITIDEVGPDVVATGGGTINITALTNAHINSTLFPYLQSNFAAVGLGELTAKTIDSYDDIPDPHPTSFGNSMGFSNPTMGSGDSFGVDGSIGRIYVPTGYMSGSQLSAKDTYSGQNFSSLGLTPGTYTWTWGTGADADFFTVQIGTAATAVPEPSTALVAGFGALAGLGAWARRRRRAIG